MLTPGDEAAAALLQDRVIILGSLDAAAAQLVTANLLLLERRDAEAEISLFVNDGNGPIEPALTVYDCMNAVSCPVSTIATGSAGTAAALLVSAGAPGRRGALPNSRFVLRLPAVELAALPADVESLAAEARRLRELVAELLARHTARRLEEISEALDRGRFLSAGEAVAWGLVDRVLERPPRAWRGIIA